MYPPIFKQAEKQALFDKQGFVVLDFLSRDSLQQLIDMFHEMHPAIQHQGFVSSSYANDFNYKKQASDRITTIFKQHFEQHFQNYTPFGSAFLYKTPSPNSELAIHQDWTIVDESKHVALNVWVPLIDVNENNGALYVLPGSQSTALPTLRAPTMPFFFSGYDKELIEHCIPMCVKAGQAVVLNQSLVHYSPPNNSNDIRIAITSGIKTKDAPMLFHYKNEDKIEQFAMDDNFLISFENFGKDIFERPKMGTSLGFIDYQIPQYEKKELFSLLANMQQNAGYEATAQQVVAQLVKAETATKKANNTTQKKGFLNNLLSFFSKN